MSMDVALDTFIAEAQELLEVMESVLLRIGDGDCEAETLNEVFRAAHTIKGSSGLFGLTHIVNFTHNVENVLDHARDGDIQIDDKLLGVLLKCCDHISLLVAAVVAGREINEQELAAGDELIAALTPWLLQAGEDVVADHGEVSKETTTEMIISDDAVANSCWHLSIQMGSDCLRNGMDPTSIFRFLQSLGEFEYFITLDQGLPAMADFDAENLYLGFEIGLKADCERDAIDDAFMFVRDESQLTIIPPRGGASAYRQLIAEKSEQGVDLASLLIERAVLTAEELETPKPPATAVTQTATAAASPQSPAQGRGAAAATRYIRVEAERLDCLINLIGELVVNRQRIDLLAANYPQGELHEAIASMGGFTEQIRDAALDLRMVQIGDTFQRFKRVVRDSAAELGKDIKLQLEGTETELDRSMVEKLTDPLTHIVRNSIDHGIEPSEIRVQRGKSAQGLLRLSAFHEAGNIVIEIADDGGGLNVDKIREKALENGVISEQDQLSDHEIHQLIFSAGLSTAKEVTDLSGRGVGMDVVLRNIESLQGSINIHSNAGEGTTITIRLPLTLAIIDGFHVSACGTDFIIPQATILECMDFHLVRQNNGQQSVNIRGELVPYILLRELFSLADSPRGKEKLVVVCFGQQRAAIVVDELLGELQTVVKPLGPIFQSLRGVGGSSLLGSGEVAFILDIPQLINFAVCHESRSVGLQEESSHDQ